MRHRNGRPDRCRKHVFLVHFRRGLFAWYIKLSFSSSCAYYQRTVLSLIGRGRPGLSGLATTGAVNSKTLAIHIFFVLEIAVFEVTSHLLSGKRLVGLDGFHKRYLCCNQVFGAGVKLL